MKYSELDASEQRLIAREHDAHTEHDRQLRDIAEDRWLRYLVLTNGGGAVAALGFIGTAQTLGPRPYLAALCVSAFAIGMALTGLLIYVQALFWRKLYHKFDDLFYELREDMISVEAFTNRMERHNRWVGAFAWMRQSLEKLAFLAFLSGVSFGAVSVLPVVAE